MNENARISFGYFIDNKINISEMGVTRLHRKDRRNKSKAKNKIKAIRQLTAKPVIKNVDIEELKASFNKADKAKPSTAKEKKAAPSKEEKATAKAEPKADASETPKTEE